MSQRFCRCNSDTWNVKITYSTDTDEPDFVVLVCAECCCEEYIKMGNMGDKNEI